MKAKTTKDNIKVVVVEGICIYKEFKKTYKRGNPYYQFRILTKEKAETWRWFIQNDPNGHEQSLKVLFKDKVNIVGTIKTNDDGSKFRNIKSIKVIE